MNEKKRALFDGLRKDVQSNSHYISVISDLKEFDEEWAKAFIQIVNTGIGFVGPLPASENHHHADLCGLLQHSIEVADFSLKIALRKVFVTSSMNANKQLRIQAANYFACCLTGFGHDFGKVLADVTVHAGNSMKWNPILSSLENFVEKYGEWGYSWRINRKHKIHEVFSGLLFVQLVPPVVWERLWSIDPNIQYEIFLALSGQDCQSVIREVVSEADSLSVSENLKSKKAYLINQIGKEASEKYITRDSGIEHGSSSMIPDDSEAVIELLKAQIRQGSGNLIDGKVIVTDKFYVTQTTCLDRICYLNPIFKKPFLVALLKGPQKEPVLKIIGDQIFLERQNEK